MIIQQQYIPKVLIFRMIILIKPKIDLTLILRFRFS